MINIDFGITVLTLIALYFAVINRNSIVFAIKYSISLLTYKFKEKEVNQVAAQIVPQKKIQLTQQQVKNISDATRNIFIPSLMSANQQAEKQKSKVIYIRRRGGKLYDINGDEIKSDKSN